MKAFLSLFTRRRPRPLLSQTTQALLSPFSYAPTLPRSHAHHALLLLLLCPLLSAHAAVRFDVFLGYDGILPEASWFPLAFEVQNDGPAFVGVVEISPGQYSQSQTRLVTVELPTGTMKRFVVPVFSPSRHGYNYNWNVRL